METKLPPGKHDIPIKTGAFSLCPVLYFIRCGCTENISVSLHVVNNFPEYRNVSSSANTTRPVCMSSPPPRRRPPSLFSSPDPKSPRATQPLLPPLPPQSVRVRLTESQSQSVPAAAAVLQCSYSASAAACGNTALSLTRASCARRTAQHVLKQCV